MRVPKRSIGIGLPDVCLQQERVLLNIHVPLIHKQEGACSTRTGAMG